MQTRSAFFAFGGMIPPAVAAGGDVTWPLLACGMFCFSVTVGGSVDRLYTLIFKVEELNPPPLDSIELPFTETTPLQLKRNYSICQSQNSTELLAGRSPAEQLASDELAILEAIIDSNHLDVEQSTGTPPRSVDGIVTTVLDATPYCQITDEERNDPFYRPNINRTLSFAPPSLFRTISNATEPMQGLMTISPANSILMEVVDSINFVPGKSAFLLAMMTCVYNSSMTTFLGWFPTYFQLGAFSDGTDWSQMGTQTVSTFFLFMAVGCLFSIPCSVFISTTKMLRAHIALMATGGVLLQLAVVFASVPVKVMLLMGAAFMGFGLSAILPLTVTIANDYGFTM
jgi:hypothetical protein